LSWGELLAGGKDRQLDVSNLYSNIDTMDTTIDGKKVVDSQAMGGCITKLSPDGDKFVYIDCAVCRTLRRRLSSSGSPTSRM
jgi:hypothetical protein